MDIAAFEELKRGHRVIQEGIIAATKRDMSSDEALALLTLDRDLIDEAISELKLTKTNRRLSESKGPKPYHGRGLQVVPPKPPDNVVTFSESHRRPRGA